jgi:hypothetical protein
MWINVKRGPKISCCHFNGDLKVLSSEMDLAEIRLIR